MVIQPSLIVQVPRGGGADRPLDAHALPSMESGKVAVEAEARMRMRIASI